MHKIIVYGDRNEKNLSQKIVHALEKFGGVLYLSPEKVQQCREDVDFLVVDTDNLEKIVLNNAILIFKNKLNISDEIKVFGNIIAVVEENNHIGLESLKSLKLLTLTCGMSSKGTLTLSSIGENSAVVSIQRTIWDLKKCMLEPCEIKISFSKKLTNFEIMSICTVLLLSNKIDNGIINV